ncbi:hypothetical protein ILT44_23330 [Microvirga sp. BT689]|uniref:DUF6603 domain-containing protein n=1 Tax=Microvirga arvi TaxID=2778731 RepID=UPI00194F3AE2|nr:DUF6603 domain-containing protein [Microvirga arvi]MBM6583138.1 hypothetical protein [Microvirga arvi]
MSDLGKVTTELDVMGATGQPDTLVSFNLVVAGTFHLPGLAASVDRFGVAVEIKLNKAGNGDFGPFDYVPKFTVPSGMSAELNLPPVSGGGYLAKFSDSELRGAFSANLGIIDVNALAVIGLSKFSMLVMMAAEFQPPLQLSFGFTLAGVGGLVGVNRRADRDALTEATSTGDLSRLMFPRDPVAEAPRLLDVASRCFPYEEGGIIVGPMIKVGWGTPTMLSATLAVILSTADDKAIILGRIAATIPAEAAPVIFLQAVVYGEIDQNGIRIDASLANSRIIFMPIEGDFRLRLITGPDPLFALSAGGFYPGFPTPEGMAGMRRLRIDLSPSPLIRLRAEAYLAITTTAIQFGARVELQVGVDGYGIHGYLQFDAFINFDPLAFEARLVASVSVECADFNLMSVTLNAALGGPSRWYINGHATIEILLWDIDIDLPSLSWGPEAERIRARDPLEAFVTALKLSTNWTVTSASGPQIVKLRSGPGEETLIHPLSGISFRQNSVPIETKLALMDGVSLEKPVVLHVAAHKGDVFPVPDQFIPARFIQQDDNARLSRSGYVDLPGGFDVEPAPPTTGPESVRVYDYEIRELRNSHLGLLPLRRDDLTAPVHGVTVRPAKERPVLIRIKDPTTPIDSDGGLTDAAGWIMDKAPAWEMQA